MLPSFGGSTADQTNQKVLRFEVVPHDPLHRTAQLPAPLSQLAEKEKGETNSVQDRNTTGLHTSEDLQLNSRTTLKGGSINNTVYLDVRDDDIPVIGTSGQELRLVGMPETTLNLYILRNRREKGSSGLQIPPIWTPKVSVAISTASSCFNGVH